ncbi:MAG: hypothetical protein ABI947_08810 [Chloroflexota bacterium]
MGWIVIAAAGIAVTLAVAFWKQIVNWANQRIAGWLGELFGDDVKEAFLLILAGVDRSVILVQRAATEVQARLIRARVLFRQVNGGREQEKVVKAEMLKEDGDIIELEAADIVPWHELPDDVREKFIRRQAASVEMELKLKK